MTIFCRACDSPTNAYLCRPCTNDLRRALEEMPRDLADLQAVATRQAVGPLGLGSVGRIGERRSKADQWVEVGGYETGSLGESPWDFAPGAADQLWAAANTLGTWVRHLSESRGVKLPIAERGRWLPTSVVIERNRPVRVTPRVFIPAPEQPLGTLVDWLLTNIESIRLDEAAKAIHDEIIGLHEENLRWSLGRGGSDVFAGNCDVTQVGFALDGDGVLQPVAATCGVALYGREGEPYVRCSACGTRYELERRLAEIHNQKINDKLARASTIASALSTFEAMLPQERLRKWIQRDLLREPAQEGPACAQCRHATCRAIRRPPIQAKSFDDDGFPLYRFGDVRRRLQQVKGPEAERESA